MNETSFTREVVKKWRARFDRPIFHHKVADPMAGGFATSTRAVDSWIVIDGISVAIEWKLLKSTHTIPLDRVREAQIETLDKHTAAGGVSFIMIGVVSARGNLIYVLTTDQWLACCNTATEAGRKSVPLVDYAPGFVHLPSTKSKYDFNPQFLIDEVNKVKVRIAQYGR